MKSSRRIGVLGCGNLGTEHSMVENDQGICEPRELGRELDSVVLHCCSVPSSRSMVGLAVLGAQRRQPVVMLPTVAAV